MKKTISKIFFVAIFLLIIPLLGTTGSAATDSELAQQYAPILYFEGEETCFPVDVSYHIDNSYLYEITEAEEDFQTELKSSSPSVADLIGGDTESYFLDNQQGTVDDEDVITDYQSKMSSLGYTVYARVMTDGGSTVIQYWMFYAFNKGELNQHEGDWEMVQIVLSDGTPTQVMYSQHYSGQRATWDQVERDGDHSKVYVARGSHANYLRSYSGKFGMASDYVGSNGRALQPDDYTLELLESQGWLSFEGRWGEVGSFEDVMRGKIGPEGPMYRAGGEMWNNPTSWGASLSPADDMIFLIEWLIYHFVTIFLLITALSLCIVAFRIYRRHKKYGLGPRIVSMLYIDGFNLKSIGNIVCIVGVLIAIFGLLYSWYTVSIGIGAEGISGFDSIAMVDFISIDGINGIQMNLFDPTSGPVQLASFTIPFSLIIGIGLVFLVLATVGLPTSRKIGRKYLWRGIKILLPIVIILVIIMMIGMFIPSSVGEGDADVGIADAFGALSRSPFGGKTSIPVEISEGGSASLDMQWGLGLGGKLLLIAGFVIIMAGILEIIAKKTFFEPKAIETPKKKKSKKTVEPEKPTENVEEIELPTPEGSEEKK